jgi:hypothetical protein
LEEIIKHMPPDAEPYSFLDHDAFIAVRKAYHDRFDDLQPDLPLNLP